MRGARNTRSGLPPLPSFKAGKKALMQRPEVEVLLATYNGDGFLSEQIDSIFEQDYPTLRVLASDDGSQDATGKILAEYGHRFPDRFHLLESKSSTGSAKLNFLRLMKAATGTYVCFADQDDVWLPNKVSRCMEAMQEVEVRHGKALPLLIFTDLRVVDRQLRMMHPSLWKQLNVNPESIHRLEQLVGRSVVTGCTALINRPLLELARSMPPEAPMHDRWIGMLAATMGAAAIVADQTVLYRQHESNVVGAAEPDNSVPGIVSRAARPDGRRAERTRSEAQVEALLRLHGNDMPEANANLLRAYLRSGRSSNPLRRIATTLRYGFSRGGPLKNLLTLFDLALSPSDGTPGNSG
jgi:glycosyltransferase involved in cell wall biosynthesis